MNRGDMTDDRASKREYRQSKERQKTRREEDSTRAEAHRGRAEQLMTYPTYTLTRALHTRQEQEEKCFEILQTDQTIV